ncbi:Sensor histidine kinase YycG [compost metagenome]
MRVTLQQAPGAYTIIVADAGPGISPQNQEHIFERFYRVDGSRSRNPADAGAGLGLSLARWIARVHGGDVTLAHSSSEGSTFLVTLPYRD